MSAKRIAVISDTHGYLSEALLEQVQQADLIVHAGDICSASDYRTLSRIAPLKLCLGNNDWGYDYGPDVKKLVRFYYQGLTWQVCHYQERLDLPTCQIAVCGHTHRPFVKKDESGTLVMNPGSPTFPRTQQGPTMGWITAEDGKVLDAQIVQLEGSRPVW